MDYINGYALALFSLAKEEKKLQEYKDQALEIIESVKENDDYILLLNKKSLHVDERKKLVSSAFGSMEKNILNFIYVLVERTKANMMVRILNKLLKFINEELKISEGVIYTPEKISPAEIKKIETKVANQLGLGKLSLVNKIDREIAFGFKVVVEDEIIEDTIASRLEQIKNELLEREGK